MVLSRSPSVRQIRLEHETRRPVEPLDARPPPSTRAQLRPNPHGIGLTELGPVRVERVDTPYETLHGRSVLVNRHELSNGERVQLCHQDGRRRSIPREHLVWSQVFYHRREEKHAPDRKSGESSSSESGQETHASYHHR